MQDQPVTRRQFTRSCAAAAGAVAAALVPGGPSAPAAGAEPATEPAAPAGSGAGFIDVHTHIGKVWNTTKDLTVDDLLRWMDEHEVARAVVLPLVSPESSSYLITNDFVLAHTKPHRDRLIPLCCMDPRTSFTGGSKELEAMLQKWVDQGAKGFGEHKVGLPIDHPRSMRLYAVCGRMGLPVLFHLDEQRNTDAPGLPGLEKALKEHPDTTFIGHGPGWWASISGDVKDADLGKYPNTPVAPGGAIERLMDAYPNLYGDLSAGSGAGALQRDLKFAREFFTRRADRLMFGTDYLSPGQPVPQFEVLRQLELPADVAAKVFHENARRLLKL